MQISPELSIAMDLTGYSPVRNEIAEIHASGSKDNLIHLAQQLAWISAVFRVPRDSELTYSDVSFEKTGPLQFKMTLMHLQKVENANGFCWHSLFLNSVIARGFPIPDRGKEVGIEIPFEVMVSLACVLYPMEYHGGTILRGIKLTLVPTAHCSGSVQWHCVPSEQDCYLPQADEVMKRIPDWFKTPDFELLKSARTFLGYCGIAEIHLGTCGIDYKSIRKSDARSERSRPKISREISTTLALSIKGIFTATLGPKITIPRSLRATTKLNHFFQDLILRAKDQPSILYDVGRRQGWLVPELSVVLHIAHTWASRQPDIAAEVLEKIPHAAVSGDGGVAAWDAIEEGKSVELRKDSMDEKPQLFGDVIKNVLCALESRKDSAAGRDDTFFEFHTKTGSGLRGWDFVDVVDWKYSSERKEVEIERKTAGEWSSIAAENPDLMVLFCKDLGQPIKPAKQQKVCRLWSPIPEGRCYLTASVPCLKKLSDNCGGTESRPKLTRRLHWHRPQGASLFGGCNESSQNECNCLQELVVEKKAVAPGPLEPYGAVIFGKRGPSTTMSCKSLSAPSEDRLEDTTATHTTSHQVGQSPLPAPPVMLGPLAPNQTGQKYDHSSRAGPRRRTAAEGVPQKCGPDSISSLVNGTSNYRVRPS